MVEEKEKAMFLAMTNGYSAILNALETMGLNIALVARTAANDMKPKIRGVLNKMLGGKIPKSINEMFEMAGPFLKTFGFDLEVEFPEENTLKCRMNGCLNRPLAEQFLAEGKEGCPLCMGAFMAAITLNAFDIGEIDRFVGKANTEHCIFEIKMRKKE